MTKEQIEKAADEFAERDYLHKGFYHGAQWRINAVWHDMGTKCRKYMETMGIQFIRKYHASLGVIYLQDTVMVSATGT